MGEGGREARGSGWGENLEKVLKAYREILKGQKGRPKWKSKRNKTRR